MPLAMDHVCCTVAIMAGRAQTRDYPPPEQRDGTTPPHVSLRTLRRALGLTLEDVQGRVQECVPELTASRGTLSAIESGSRGVSALMLQALERAYRLEPGELTTDYVPRGRNDLHEVA